MSIFKESKEENEYSDDENIKPSDLIDTEENKPKIAPKQEDLNEVNDETHKQIYKKIEKKQVSKLTNEEKNYLINLYKNGGEDENFKVKFYKNGSNQIIRKKPEPKYNTSKRLIEQHDEPRKPHLTNEQLIMEHIIDLETKYATLYQKHKKLKKNYKALHEDIYCLDDDNAEDSNAYRVAQQAEPKEEIKEIEQKQEPRQEIKEEPKQEPLQEQYTADNYINKIRRPQKGYRGKMMAAYGLNI